MLRRYGKRRTFSKRNKYSVEQTTFLVTLPAITNENRDTLDAQVSIPIVPPTEVQGMRKVKNFTISLASVIQSEDMSFFYALVYAPQGYLPGVLNTPVMNNARSMYEANQYVISCGVIDLSAGPQRIFSKLSRNLNSGDNIHLILKNAGATTGATKQVQGLISYAVTLQ